MACNAFKVCKVCAVLVLCLLHIVAPLNVPTGASVVCAFSGWVPPEGYVPRRLRNEATDASELQERLKARVHHPICVHVRHRLNAHAIQSRKW